MDDKGIQVAMGLKWQLTITGSQTTPEIPKEERTTQQGMSLTGSYSRNREHTYASRNICQFVGQIICSGAGI